MDLFVVRLIADKQAVGIFWCQGTIELETLVEEVCDVWRCEFCVVDNGVPSAIIWPEEAKPIGVYTPEQHETNCTCTDLMLGAQLDGELSGFADGLFETDPVWEQFCTDEEIAQIEAAREKSAKPLADVKYAQALRGIGLNDLLEPGSARRVYFIAQGTGSPEPVELLAEIMGASPRLEAELHRRFAEHRVRGEWFKQAHDLMEFIYEIAAINGTWE